MRTERLTIATSRRTEIVPIGRAIDEALPRLAIDAGTVLVTVGHTTCALTLNESEPGLLEDLETALERIVPWGAGYRHDRGAESNAAAHIRAALLGHQLVLQVRGGRLALGAWQDVLLVELDGPRSRKVEIAPLS